MKNYKAEILLSAPEIGESDNCRDRIFSLIDELGECKKLIQDIKQLQITREYCMHKIRFIASRLLWELNA